MSNRLLKVSLLLNLALAGALIWLVVPRLGFRIRIERVPVDTFGFKPEVPHDWTIWDQTANQMAEIGATSLDAAEAGVYVDIEVEQYIYARDNIRRVYVDPGVWPILARGLPK